MKRLVIGILAHVDAGKTTLSEGLLYRAGVLRKLGRVDHGSSLLDDDSLERERGITIFSKQAILPLQETELTLLDTPGHVDFSPEMERTLQVLDAAVLVISGTDGVQSHTETLWELLRLHHIPVFLFVNKMDLNSADRTAVLAELNARLDDGCIDFSADVPAAAHGEALAMCSERLMEEYLTDGAVSEDAIADAIAQRQVFPCWFGSALKLNGVADLLDGLRQYARPPVYVNTFAAKVFKISRDEQGQRLTHLKVTGGTLKVKAQLQGTTAGTPWAEKINQIRRYSGGKFTPIDEALPGMVVSVTGLTHTHPGQGLGAEPDADDSLLAPVLTYRVELPAGTVIHKVLSGFRQLEEEDPQLHITWNEELQEIHVHLMGDIQLEVLQRLMAERFGFDVAFGEGSIVYLETIATTVEGVGHFEPLRHYAEVHLRLDPAPRGSGLHFASDCSEDALDLNWQRLIITHLMEKSHRGVLTGSPITDVTLTLTAGRAHKAHTEGGDFRQATYRAVRQGLRQAEPVLLEPFYNFRLFLPAENVGQAMSDLQRMDCTFNPPEPTGDTAVLIGTGPVSELRGYTRNVLTYTHGRGRLSCSLRGYALCHNTAEIVERIGYDCDGDVENTADSVFCAHGSGFVVKWDQVPDYMHLPATVVPPAMEPETHSPVRRTVSYGTTDSELMDIYERTYGKVSREPRAAFRTARPAESLDEKVSIRPMENIPSYLLVDGYNIIFAWDNLKTLSQNSLDDARNRLIEMMCNYQGYRKCNLILVFDAYKVKGNPGDVEQVNGISVVYTKEAETADMYIEKVTHRIEQKHQVRVATSDGMEQLIVLGHGALRISAEAFRAEVDTVLQEIDRFLSR